MQFKPLSTYMHKLCCMLCTELVTSMEATHMIHMLHHITSCVLPMIQNIDQLANPCHAAVHGYSETLSPVISSVQLHK